jgi:hypothetical protein
MQNILQNQIRTNGNYFFINIVPNPQVSNNLDQPQRLLQNYVSYFLE